MTDRGHEPHRRMSVVVMVLATLIGGCSAGPGEGGASTSAPPAPVPSTDAAETSPAPDVVAPHLTYVALGDSLLYALAEDCDGCASAAVLYGEQIQSDLGMPVEVHNLTMHNGLDSAGLRDYLQDGARIGRDPEDVFAAVAAADIVTVTIGFNDIKFSARDDLDALMLRFEGNLDTILQLFDGPDGTSSPGGMGYLGPDGVHPSQEGMDLIAAALVASGYAPLR